MRAFLHTIWWRRVDLYSYTSHFDLSGHLYGDSNTTMPIHCFIAHHSSSIYVPSVTYAEATHERYHHIPTHHMVAESRPLQLTAPTSPHQDTSMAIATQPCLSIVS